MKRLVAAGLPLLAGVGVLFGCAKGEPTLVGTWTTESQLRGLPTLTEATFEKGGQYQAVTRYLSDDKVQMTSTTVGTWKLSDRRLTLKLTDATWKLEDTNDEAAKQAVATFRENKQAVLDSVNNAGPIEVIWLNPDQLELKVKEGTYAYKRKY